MTADAPFPLLILSDGKPGHLNQSIAFARHLGRPYEVVRVTFRRRWFKLLSYLADRCFLQIPQLLEIGPLPARFAAVVATGSETYYACRILARRARVPAIAIMLPRGYRYAFHRIIAQQHDEPPRRDNILALPINLSWNEPRGVFRAEAGAPYVGVVVGGPNKVYAFDPALLRRQLLQLFDHYPNHRLVVATSRRTPVPVEEMLRKLPFSRCFYYSEDPANPIPDLLLGCEHVFITADSTSMISEAVSCGHARVDVLPLPARRAPGKYGRLVERLEGLGCLHRFDGQPGLAAVKIDLASQLRGVLP